MTKRAKVKADDPIVIGAVDIPVKHSPHLDGYGAFTSMGENGPYIEYSHLIPPELKSSTIFHEALHALSDLTGLDLTEKQVAELEHFLPRLIVDNWATFRPIFLKMNGGKPLT